MPRIVECVPNFSVGRNQEVVEAIASAITATEGCKLLDVDPDMSSNRTVYTFVGTPETVVEGALNAARVAYHAIDMRLHQGQHPRIGAMDVCPFVQIKDVTMEECLECAKELGEKLAAELDVPVYLYSEDVTEEHRKTLEQIRDGEYESLPEKLTKPEWKPDFGPAEFIPSWGATVVGARKFIIAYNVNLLCTKEQAHAIAVNIRDEISGHDKPGQLKHVQAIGWYLDEANLAQVSVNITDFEQTPIHMVYEAVCKQAEDLNVAVVGSQIIGHVPLQALMTTAQYYMDKCNMFILEEDQKLRLVVNRLGLNSLESFNPKERIIDYMISEETDGSLVSMDVKDFILTVGSRSPYPGGGCVSALAGSLGAALGSMVGFLTCKDEMSLEMDNEMRKLIPPMYKAMKDLTPFIDVDGVAFSEYMVAMKLSADDEEDIEICNSTIQEELCTAVQVPLTMSRICSSLWEPLKEMAKIGNINCKADLQVGVRMLETSIWGAYYNLKSNLDYVKDQDFKTAVSEEIDVAVKLAQENCAAVLKTLEERKE